VESYCGFDFHFLYTRDGEHKQHGCDGLVVDLLEGRPVGLVQEGLGIIPTNRIRVLALSQGIKY
jgi:hypothetical protein